MKETDLSTEIVKERFVDKVAKVGDELANPALYTAIYMLTFLGAYASAQRSDFGGFAFNLMEMSLAHYTLNHLLNLKYSRRNF